MPHLAEKKQDKATRLVYARLKERFPDLPSDVQRVVYRYNPASIRVRVIDPRFAGMTYTQREEMIEDLLRDLPKDVRADITVLLLITPEEAGDPSDLMNLEFDEPSASRL
jgi:stress-induced morphogen